MSPLGLFGLALLAQTAIAVAWFYVSRRGNRANGLATVVAVFAALAAPFIVPQNARLLRALAAVAAVTAGVKLYDLARAARRGAAGPTLIEFLGFLPNIDSLVYRKLADEPQPPAAQAFVSLVINGVACAAAAVLLVMTFRFDWRPYPLPAEHAAKVVAFFLVVVPLSAAATAVRRLLGGRGLDFMDNPFVARTPADFWRRYNRPVHRFMEVNVFKSLDGRRHPLRAIAVVFIVSALVHEYVFFVPIGRVQGYQTAFFLIQGAAVAATARLRPRGWRAPRWVAVTFAFNLLTTVVFFASVNQVVPFYQRRDSPPVSRPAGVPVREIRRSIPAAGGIAQNAPHRPRPH